MSSDGDANDALANLRRELRDIQERGAMTSDRDEPPAAELEALAQTLTRLRSDGAVPFDRNRTWQTIEQRLSSPTSERDETG